MIYSLSIAKKLRLNIAISSFVWWVPVGMTMDHIPFMVDFLYLDYIPICFVWLQNPKFWLVKTPHVFFWSVETRASFQDRSSCLVYTLPLMLRLTSLFFPNSVSLGSSAIVKISSEQPKSRLPKFPGSQEGVPKQVFPARFLGRGSQARFPSKVLKQGSQARFPGTGSQRFPRTGSQARFSRAGS